MISGATPSRLVGRGPELAALHSWVAACAAGRGRVGLIEGEPGIGKSALIDEVCDTAAGAGLAVLHGAGDELGQALPLLPFLAALNLERPRTPDKAADERRASVRQLLRGEVAFRSVDAVSAAAEQVFALVEDAAARGPALLVVDDLQWADPATVALWARLARSTATLPLLLIGAVRTASPKDLLRPLRRAVDAADLLRPGPLAEPAVSALLADLTGGRPGPRLTALAADAAGNPLYLTELVGVLERGARLATGAPGTIDISAGPAPATLAAAIADRLDFLADHVRTTLRAAALLGQHFAVEDLATVQERSVAGLLPVLDEAVAAGVLVDSGDGLAFRHPLIRAALYEELVPSVRRAYHREAARALAAAGAPVDRVARQLLPAAATGQPDAWMLDWLADAGPALTAQTPEIAIDLLRRAVAAASGRAHGMLALHLADALNRTGALPEAEQVASAALARVTDPDISTELHWTLGEARINLGRFTRDQVDDALTRPGLTSRHRARLLAVKARLRQGAGSLDEACDLADEALAEATAAGDNRDIAWALHIRMNALVVRGGIIESMPLFDRAIAAVADEPELADLRLLLGVNHAIGLGALDRVDEAVEQAFAVRAVAARSGSTLRLAQAHSAIGEVLYDAGRWDEALESLLALPDDVKDVATAADDHGHAALILLHRGDAAGAVRHLAAGEPQARTSGHKLIASVIRARALLAEHEGRPDEALALLAANIDHQNELDEVDDLIPDAIRLGHDTAVGARAATMAEHLRSKADVPHRAGAVLLAAGVRGRDPALLVRAAERYRAAKRPLFEAMALSAAAEIAAVAGDRASARAAFTEAGDGYERLGAVWDLARLQGRLRPHGIRRAPRAPHRAARHGWDSLTPAETKVVDLVVRGLSNPQIAEALYLSPRTVGTHVSHILAKLNLNSRTDLAREAARRF